MCDTVVYREDDEWKEIYTCDEFADILKCKINDLVTYVGRDGHLEVYECLCNVDIEQSALKHGKTASEIPECPGDYELFD